jgi:hypothetical protein
VTQAEPRDRLRLKRKHVRVARSVRAEEIRPFDNPYLGWDVQVRGPAEADPCHPDATSPSLNRRRAYIGFGLLAALFAPVLAAMLFVSNHTVRLVGAGLIVLALVIFAGWWAGPRVSDE